MEDVSRGIVPNKTKKQEIKVTTPKCLPKGWQSEKHWDFYHF